MKKEFKMACHFIDYNTCENCKHLIHVPNNRNRVCEFNELILFFEWKEDQFIYRLSGPESKIENIDERCPEIITHFARCKEGKALMEAIPYTDYIKN